MMAERFVNDASELCDELLADIPKEEEI
jgi:hypothetical protein